MYYLDVLYARIVQHNVPGTPFSRALAQLAPSPAYETAVREALQVIEKAGTTKIGQVDCTLPSGRCILLCNINMYIYITPPCD